MTAIDHQRQGGPAPHEALIATLRRRIDNTVQPLICRASAVALLDCPNHGNVGDSAIWLGELAYLRSLGIQQPDYTCDIDTYCRDNLARRIGEGVIVLTGGGNLGDLWREHQRFRERVIKDFPHNSIVQLPQSIHFQDRHALTRARGIFSSHAALTLLVRDRKSLAIAQNDLRVPAFLCPDMALCLGPLARPAAPTRDVVWLSRTDKESRLPRTARSDAGVERQDWVEERATGLIRLSRLLDRQTVRHPRSIGPLIALRSRVREQVARQRLRRGCRLLAEGRAVITDRLHGHILSLLLGIPHFLLDNSNGKVRSFYETWTSSIGLARWCCTAADAVSWARST